MALVNILYFVVWQTRGLWKLVKIFRELLFVRLSIVWFLPYVGALDLCRSVVKKQVNANRGEKGENKGMGELAYKEGQVRSNEIMLVYLPPWMMVIVISLSRGLVIKLHAIYWM